jgi:hypothetical protein
MEQLGPTWQFTAIISDNQILMEYFAETTIKTDGLALACFLVNPY